MYYKKVFCLCLLLLVSGSSANEKPSSEENLRRVHTYAPSLTPIVASAITPVVLSILTGVSNGIVEVIMQVLDHLSPQATQHHYRFESEAVDNPFAFLGKNDRAIIGS